EERARTEAVAQAASGLHAVPQAESLCLEFVHFLPQAERLCHEAPCSTRWHRPSTCGGQTPDPTSTSASLRAVRCLQAWSPTCRPGGLRYLSNVDEQEFRTRAGQALDGL